MVSSQPVVEDFAKSSSFTLNFGEFHDVLPLLSPPRFSKCLNLGGVEPFRFPGYLRKGAGWFQAYWAAAFAPFLPGALGFLALAEPLP
jgi:hypothetical protein